MSKNGLQLASDLKYYLDYSRWIDDENRTETWEDSVNRVMNMHREKYSQFLSNPRFVELFEKAENAYKERLVLGSQRALQFGGEPIIRHNARLYNCTATYVNRVRSFQEIMYLLLCGCGVGFSVQYKHINKLPNLVKRTKGTKTFVVPDSIEGWSDAFGILVSSYVEEGKETPFTEYQGYEIRFDLSLIRPEGAMISGGFKAPGPEGLRKSLLKGEELIERNLNQGVNVMKPIMAYDFIMYMADAVLSGGVRRSATICLFSPEDNEMINAKVGNWYYENPQRGRSNNSAVINRNTTTKEQFNSIFTSIKDFGEPGFYFVDDEDQVTNPCVTKDTTVMTNEGVFTVEDLIGVKKKIVVNGEEHDMMSDGFWKTGEKDVYKLTTNKGYQLRLTENHKVLTVNSLNVETWKELKDINIGDKVKLNKNIGYVWGNQDNSEFEKGWLLGNLIGDGTFDKESALLKYWNESNVKEIAKTYLNNNFKTYQEFSAEENNDGIVSIGSVKLKEFANQFGVRNNDKLPNKKLEQQSSKFYEGFISGLIDADGTIHNDTNKGDYNIRLNQSNVELLNIVQRMLLRLGIVSTLYKNRRKEGFRQLPDGNGGLKEYYCKSNHDLQISKTNVREFNQRIKLNSKKQSLVIEMLDKYKPYSEYFNDVVSSIEYDGFEDVYDVNVEDVHRFDANGIIVHNCVEIGLYPQIEINGKTEYGFQGCNLTEGNGGMCTTEDKFYEACESLAILGTLQAGYADFPYLGDITESIFRGEALLGCSFTGWMANPHIMMNPEIQRKGAEIVKKVNQELAEIIGINPASRTTCVKPSGNASVLLKSPSGCHGDHAPRYFRVMQINKQSEIGKYLNEEHSYLIEESVWSSNKTDYVAYIPVMANKNAKFKKDLVGMNQLEVVKTIQNNWVEYGTNHERNVQPYLRHSVSNTVELDYSDYDMVEDYLFNNRYDFAAVSFLPLTGDKDFNQAPFTSVLSGEELYNKYDDAAFFASGLIVDGLHAFDGNLWEACDYVNKRDLKLQGTRVEGLIKKDWIRRAKQFAKRFFKGDIKEMILCLKDLHLYHKWVRINRELKQRDFDFNTAIKQPEYVNMDTMGAQACAAGSCELPEYMLEAMKG
jgi:intein/homing endonuclease